MVDKKRCGRESFTFSVFKYIYSSVRNVIEDKVS